ncbi:MAG: sigma-54-dependent transcriptional regulator [Candidatus Sumerlaeaceae bacterium]
MASETVASSPRRASIVVVDDEENMGKILSRILELEGYHVNAFSNPTAAVEHLRKTPPDLVITDMRMPELTGLDVLREAKAANSHTNVIVMTAYSSVETAVEAMRAGAFDYITKPFKTDELVLSVGKAVANTRLLEENEVLTETLHRQVGVDSELVGTSPPLNTVKQIISKAAPSDAAVLIRGESGTGKELVAKSIHRQSPRRKKRFVAINCASIPENLLESELFGYEKGAFTGADRTKMGLIELAQGGTLFLDEIGELPLPLQAKLLRVLQEREIQRVGGLHTIPIDVRLLAATNRDLKAAIAQKQFREDLYYRLDVIQVTMPPLRERPADIPVLTIHFLEKLCRRMNRKQCSISEEAQQALMRYPFPGNVRELENVIERTIVLCSCERIELHDIPADIRGYTEKFGATAEQADSAFQNGGLPTLEYRYAKDAFERSYLQRAIAAARGNISEAARMTGLSRRHFYEKLEKLGIKTER